MEKNSDIRFLKIAREVSKSSKCLSRKVGAIIVKNGCIVSEGRNGPPRNVKHCNERDFSFYLKLDNKETNGKELIASIVCPRRALGYKSGEGLHLCNAQHGEENAINQAALNGISTLGTTIYCYCCLPCKNCMGSIINAGIKEVVCLKFEPDYDTYSRILAKEAGIIVREIDERIIDAIH